MATDVKRLRYFNGEFLREPDFTTEQAYHLSMRRMHNSLLHTWGIAKGLTLLCPSGASVVTVNEGAAIDGDGKEIVLASATDTPDLTPYKGKTVYVTISFAEQQTDPTNETGVLDNTRWTEKPVIEVSDAPPSKPNQKLILGRVSLDGSGKVVGNSSDDGVEPNKRRSAGVVGGDLAVRSLVLTDPAIASAQWTKMSLGAAGRTDLLGNLQVAGNVGIGMTTPGSSLSIGSSNFRLDKSDVSPNAGYIRFGDKTGWKLHIGRSGESAGMFNNAGTAGVLLTVQDNGNVGIGTTSPAAKLQIDGSIDLLNWSQGYTIGSGQAGMYMPLNLLDLRFKTNNQDRMAILNGGNVGIGTTVPGARLEVKAGSEGQASAVEAIRIWGPNGPNNPNSAQDLKWDFSSAGSAGIRAYRDSSWGTHLQLLTNAQNQGADNPQVRMHASENGNIGIGTTTPRAKLEIVGGAIMPSAGNSALAGVLFPPDPGGGSADSAWMRFYPRSGEDCTLEIGVSNDAADHIALMPSGNVGIGTVSPSQKLHVSGGNAIVNNTYLGDVGHGAGWAGFNHSNCVGKTSYGLLQSADGIYTLINKKSGGGFIGFRVDNGDKMTIVDSGNVGIGTTSPSEKLDVAGNIKHYAGSNVVEMTNAFPNNPTKYIEYAINGPLWGVTMWASSRRFKDKVAPLELDTSRVFDLKPVSFNWKPERGGQKDFGIIAEEAEQVMPFMVAHDKEGRPFSFRYDMLSVLLLGELKKSVDEIKALRDTVGQLKTRAGNDFAEYFDSIGKKKISPGTSVVLENGKVRPAKSGEIPFGVISANPALLGGLYLEWPGKYVRDEFGALVTEKYKEEALVPKKQKVRKERQKIEKRNLSEEVSRVEVVYKNNKPCQVEKKEKVTREVETPVFKEVDLYDEKGKQVVGKHKVPVMETYEEEMTVFDEKGNPVLVGSGEFVTKERPKLNPKYNESQQYLTRDKRSEWNCVGLVGQIPLRKGQPVAPTWVKIKDVSDDIELWLVK